MNKKIFVSVGIVIIIAIGVTVGMKSKVSGEDVTNNKNEQAVAVTQILSSDPNTASPVKEFSMTSFTEVVDGKYHPQFSVKEITVNKGDTVRIKITATSGMHNFKIDEFNVFTDTPLDKESTVEFVADKAGKFIYYCAKPGHRALGQWGTLIVLDK